MEEPVSYIEFLNRDSEIRIEEGHKFSQINYLGKSKWLLSSLKAQHFLHNVYNNVKLFVRGHDMCACQEHISV